MPSSSKTVPSESESEIDLGAELVQLLGAVDRDVAGAGDRAGLAGEVVVGPLQHQGREVGGAVAGRRRPPGAAAEALVLAGEDAGEAVGEPLVLAEQEGDLALADADVAGRDVDVLADVAVQLAHHRLAEAHHLELGVALGVEVGAALGAAHRQAGERVLEGLREAEELERRQVEPSTNRRPPL